MKARVIGFIPAVIGTESSFNTFRLGSFYTKHLSVGEEVFLFNEKEKMVFGKAKVEAIESGKLGEMLLIHAHRNHTELESEPDEAPAHLFDTLKRIYGPHIAGVDKKTTVVYLSRTE